MTDYFANTKLYDCPECSQPVFVNGHYCGREPRTPFTGNADHDFPPHLSPKE